ncbi:hypothetical protein AYB34_18120 [Leptospira sp. ZV016]|nr:hypothetical protein AYB32_17815 [Leptospira kirschneri]KXZ26901.1 hypothetical protein AYB34_18120 [Leptospira sp. ZV016]
MGIIDFLLVYKTKHSFCRTLLGRCSGSFKLDYAGSQVLAGFRILYSSLIFPHNKLRIVFK